MQAEIGEYEMNDGVVGLGYLGWYSRDLASWEEYATQFLGLAPGLAPKEPESNHLLLRMDEWGWRFWIEDGEEGQLAFIGLDAGSPENLVSLAARVAEAGFAAVEDEKRAALRGVSQLFRCTDPDGNTVELFYGSYVPRAPFISPRGVKFVAGELGLGHAGLFAHDEKAMLRFYFETLGFRLSDVVRIGDLSGTFAHVNARHHTMAFGGGREPGATALEHFMLQVESIDDVGRALDNAQDGAAEVTVTLGRHTNDHMVSFYTRTPSGFEVEYGYGARLIDDSTWTASTYDAASRWGHRFTNAE
ncbi:VOC family protein [Streptomyces sp. NPDC055078]